MKAASSASTPTLRRLPEPRKPAAISLLGCKPDGVRESYQNLSALRADATNTLSLLPYKDRMKVFQTLMPGIADDFEATWQLSATVPYQAFNHMRKA